MGCESSKNSKNQYPVELKSSNNNLQNNNQLSRGKTLYIKQEAEVFCKDEECRQKIELFLRLENIKLQGTYSVRIYISEDKGTQKNFNFINETEKICKFPNIKFNTSVVTNYYFEKEQTLKVEILKDGSILESSQIPLGRVMGARRNRLSTQLNYLSFIVEARSSVGVGIIYSFDISIISFGNINPKNFFYTLGSKDENQSQIGEYRKIYKSEETESSNFQIFSIESNYVDNGNKSRKFILEFSDHKLGDFGINEVSIDILNINNIIDLKNGMKVQVKVIESKNYNFVELLRLGLNINLYIAIDYTASNGEPSDRNSLHYLYSNEPNQYERAIRNCGSICAYYDQDQMFPVLGFGALLQGSNKTNFCFNVNFQDNCEIQGIDNVCLAYKNSLTKLRFSGPTNFSPIIKYVTNHLIENLKKNIWSYGILLFITDGQISDMDQTIDEIVESSYLPLSIIIIGVGKSDFHNMNILDADDEPLMSSYGKKQQRDNVQFVSFLEFENNYDKLTEQVLAEVPSQVEQYYKVHNEAIKQAEYEIQMHPGGNLSSRKTFEYNDNFNNFNN